MTNHLDPGLEAELAYRREVLQRAWQGTRTRRGPWLRRRRPAH